MKRFDSTNESNTSVFLDKKDSPGGRCLVDVQMLTSKRFHRHNPASLQSNFHFRAEQEKQKTERHYIIVDQIFLIGMPVLFIGTYYLINDLVFYII